ncbi:histidine triad nucleotide-binding protein [Chloroflexota bacterium]
MEDCIFCKIIAGEIPSDIVYKGEDIIAFRDINPVAKTHIQIIPKKHIPTIADISDADMPLVGEMMKVANELAKSEGVAESGYRLVINCGRQSGQEVFHLHLHLIGGRRLGVMG